MSRVNFEHVWRRFGNYAAVADLTLDIPDGAFLVLLGASGSGKTTSLRMLAGLEQPSEGEIRIDGRLVNTVPPGERDVAMVFQSYALFPHMTVQGNLAFGPRMRRENKAVTKQKIAEVAETLGLTPLLDRRPAELSGGQRQRVALGRALLRQPKLFLMDEPLSNLDAALRIQMRAEIVSLHRRLGITTVYVTHDQVEAMTMATHLAIMFEGRLHQAGAPAAVFDDPSDLRVARFIGAPSMNIISGRVARVGERVFLECLGARLPLPPGLSLSSSNGCSVQIGIRPSDFSLTPPDLAAPCISGIVEFLEPMGSETFATLRCGIQTITVRVPGRAPLSLGETISIYADPRYLYAFESESGQSLIDRSQFGRSPEALRRSSN